MKPAPATGERAIDWVRFGASYNPATQVYTNSATINTTLYLQLRHLLKEWGSNTHIYQRHKVSINVSLKLEKDAVILRWEIMQRG